MRMPRLLVLLAAVCFGTTGTAQALGPDDASPVTVGAARIAVGALLLLAWEAAAKARRGGGARRAWPLAPLLAGALGVAAYQLCFFAAVKDTGVAVGTVVALGSAPALAGLGGWLLDHRVPDRAWALATALACAGVAMLALEGGGEVSAPGVALAVGAGASYAAFTLASKRLLDQGHQVEPVMARLFGLGALLLAPVLVLGDLAWLTTTGGGAAMALWLGAVPTAIAYILFASGLRHLPASEVATLTLAEPVTAALLGAVVLGERPGAVAIAGIFIILAGLVVLAAPRRRRARPVLEVPA